jgi:hypothetical protein
VLIVLASSRWRCWRWWNLERVSPGLLIIAPGLLVDDGTSRWRRWS